MHFKNKKLKPARQTACAKVQSLVLQRKEDSIESRTLLSQQKFHFSQALVKVGKILNRQNLSHTKLQAGMFYHFQRQLLASQHHFSFNIFSDFSSFMSAGEKGLSFSLRRPSFRSCRLTLEDKVREWPCVSKEEAGSFPTEKLKGTRTAVLPEMHFVRKLMFSTKTPNKVHP